MLDYILVFKYLKKKGFASLCTDALSLSEGMGASVHRLIFPELM